jgi:hypothetical protein
MPKKLPYGQSNYAYVDKTRYVELLENENNREKLLDDGDIKPYLDFFTENFLKEDLKFATLVFKGKGEYFIHG